MYRLSLPYVDDNDTDRVGVAWFHFRDHEIRIMGLSEEGDLPNRLISIGNSENAEAAYAMISALVLDAYGVKDPDTGSFEKSVDARAKFEQSAFFDAIMSYLFEEDGALTEFVNGLPSAKIQRQAKDPEILARLQKQNPQAAKALQETYTSSASETPAPSQPSTQE